MASSTTSKRSQPGTATAAKIELVRRAEVVQSTTENWGDVALTLSTARPVGATSAPDLEPYQLSYFAGREYDAMKGVAGNSQRLDAPKPASEAIMEDGALAKDEKRKEDENKFAQMQAQVEIAGFQALYAIPGRVSIDNTGTAKKVRIGTDSLDAKLMARAERHARGLIRVRAVRDGEDWHLFRDGAHRVLRLHDEHATAGADEAAGSLAAPMPGKVLQVLVQPGAQVARGAPLLVLEAMKMEHTITAPRDGTIKRIFFAAGDQVDEGAQLLELEAA